MVWPKAGGIWRSLGGGGFCAGTTKNKEPRVLRRLDADTQSTKEHLEPVASFLFLCFGCLGPGFDTRGRQQNKQFDSYCG